MVWFKKLVVEKSVGSPLVSGYVKFRSSIYGRVVFIFTISSFFLFVAFGIIFRSVNEKYMQSVIRENGNNISSLVEGALYRSMLENDRSSLQSTLDIINKMSGIDDVNMYDNSNNLVFSSIANDTINHSNPDCKNCHSDIATMFSAKEKSYRIIDVNSECTMNPNNNKSRHLLIKSPILNSPSCSTASCHAHSEKEAILGSLLIKFPMGGLDAALDKSTTDYFLMAATMTLLLILFLIFFTIKKIKDPLYAIIKASEAVAKGDKSTRLVIKPHQLSDMRMVSYAFNDMLDNLQTATNELQNWSHQLEYKVQKKSEELGQVQNELMNIERIASLGKLSLSVAHEINNPLSGILIYAKLISKQLNSQELTPTKKESMLKHLKLIENETKRCGDIVKGLLDFSHSMKVANINFLSDFSAKTDLIFCSPNQIKQVCVAILVNASEAVTENGEILIRTLNPDDQHIRIEISDNGVGISEEDIPHIFEPFFSTKEKASGIGLGLAIVHGIVQSHKGKTDVKSERGKGATILITLPLIRA